DTAKIDGRLQEINIDVACDVDNPLTGKRGASAVFGPQKGANPEIVATLDQNLAHFAKVIKDEQGIDVDQISGSGASGGLGAGLLAFLRANMKRGVDIVTEAVQLEKQVADAALVITAERIIFRQMIYGTTNIGVAKTVKQYDNPDIGIAGLLGDDCGIVYEDGIDALFSIVPGEVTLEDAMAHATYYNDKQAENIARM